MQNFGEIGIAASLALAAVGSALGAGAAGMAAIGAWKKCFVQNKAAPFMLVAFAGIFVAYRMYIRKPDLPGLLAKKFRVAYELIFNKYYVDEIYDMAVVDPIKESSNFLWTGVDNKVVDGAVNGSAGVVAWLSAHIRKLETGFLQNYALAIVLGVALIVGYLVGL